MELPDGFIPDYEFSGISGVFCDRKSQIHHVGNSVFISVGGLIKEWDAGTGECINMYGKNGTTVTALVVVNNQLIAGYEDGIIEIFDVNLLTQNIGYEIENRDVVKESRRMRLHTRRVTQIKADQPGSSTGFISASMDGTICRYDLIIDELILRYDGCNSPVYSLTVASNPNGTTICASCADNTIKIWTGNKKEIERVVCFDSLVAGTAVSNDLIIAVLKNGSSFKICIADGERKPFVGFKRVKSAIMCDNIFAVHCAKQLVVYSVDDGFKEVNRFDISADAFNYDISNNRLALITKTNEIHLITEQGIKVYNGGHSSQIKSAKLYENNQLKQVYTLSAEKIILWRLDEGDSEFYCSSQLRCKDVPSRKIVTFELFKGLVVLATPNQLIIYEPDLSNAISEIKLTNVTLLASSASYLVALVDKLCFIYNSEYNLLCQYQLSEFASKIGFSSDGSLFCAALINNKIDVFSMSDPSSPSLLFSLYGHSLPVRSFDISSDNRILVSCGADRLVKIWGLEFGECRKTIISDSYEVCFTYNNMFMTAGDGLNYYENHVNLKKIHNGPCTGIISGSDFVCGVMENGLVLFRMGKYELMADETEELKLMGAEMVPGVADHEKYSRFLDQLERVSEGETELIGSLYSFLEDLEFTELEGFLGFLDDLSIHSLFDLLDRCSEKNVVLNCRIFLILSENYYDTCISNKEFEQVRDGIILQMGMLRDLIGGNIAKIGMKLEGFEL